MFLSFFKLQVFSFQRRHNSFFCFSIKRRLQFTPKKKSVSGSVQERLVKIKNQISSQTCFSFFFFFSVYSLYIEKLCACFYFWQFSLRLFLIDHDDKQIIVISTAKRIRFSRRTNTHHSRSKKCVFVLLFFVN